MLPDSDIAKKMSCGATKCAYLVNHGIAPHFAKLLADRVKQQSDIVICFDESMNGQLQTKQMDIHVRLWDNDQV